jgi:membrane-bound ClpP family serine protease
MIDWITVLLLLISGIALLIVEIIFIPGTTVLGLVGAAMVVLGVVLGYSYFGNQTGTIVLIGTLVVGAIATALSFRAGVWGKFALHDVNRAKFNEDFTPDVTIGDEGIALSALRPIGKAEFGKQVLEVRTTGQYLTAGSRLRVIRVDENNRIFVEPTN